MVTPSATEQLYLELLNRTRADPAGEAVRLFPAEGQGANADITGAISYFNVSRSAFLSAMKGYDAVAPLAWSSDLASAAQKHNGEMIRNDEQSHQLPGEASLLTRVKAEGFGAGSGVKLVAENVYAYSQNPLFGHAGFVIDWGYGAGGMQAPAGHRETIMNGTLTHVGVSITAENNSATKVGPFVVTQDFGTTYDTSPMLVGVAINDKDGDRFYDVGEGLGGITVTAQTVSGGAAVSTITWASGGYQLALAAGVYTVTFQGGGLAAPVSEQVTIGSQNVKQDLILPLPTQKTSGQVIKGGPDGGLLQGGAGADTILGGVGDDTIRAGAGNDRIKSGDGKDKVWMEAGADSFFDTQDASSDFVDGGVGNDTLRGEGGNDTYLGGDGHDLILGGVGADSLRGGAGDDTLFGKDGDDWVFGDGGRDRISLGDGNDGYFDSTQTGLGGSDLVVGDGGNDTLRGLGGNDTYLGGAGDDLLNGGTGQDVIRGGIGNDIINAGAGSDQVFGDEGRDRVWLNSGHDVFRDHAQSGFAGSDIVYGGVGNDTILGVAGNDTYLGGAGQDLILGGVGADSLRGGSGNDQIRAGAGNDTVFGDTGQDKIWLDDGNDHFFDSTQTGAGAGDWVHGGAGNDILRGGGGDDTLVGGTGADTIWGGSGSDLLNGFGGADVFVFRAGSAVDRITDFDRSEGDRIALDQSLWQGMPFQGTSDAADIVARFGTLTSYGAALNFGDGDVLRIDGVTSLDMLAGALDFLS